MVFRCAILGLLLAAPAFAADLPMMDNLEIAAIFKADQAARDAKPIDWKVVEPADKKRRARTAQLLDTGALHTGDDFYDAAFVFQHGDTPEDYLKAHLLAMIAVGKGQPDALWIASATLDRYLHHIGQPQVLGTQYTGHEDGKFTQEPYDRTIASDAMRQALNVRTLAEQEKQRRAYESQAMNLPRQQK